MHSLKIFLLTFILLTNLASASGSIRDYDGKQTTVSWIYNTPVNPINITTESDDTKKVESLIQVSGGKLTTTGNDGTVYTLEIPANALLIKTIISITPLTKMDGMPFGEGHYAVQLEPSGLQLMKPASLTIKTPNEIPVDQQLFFGYEKRGDGVFIAGPVVKTKEIKIQVVHFSGYGLTKGYAADLDAVRSQLGGSVEGKLESRLSEKMIKERQSELLGGDNTDLFQDVREAFQEYYEKVLKTRLDAANKPGASCVVGHLAQESALKLSRAADLMGISDYALELQHMAVINSVDLQCMKEEFEICRDKHIVHRIYPLWLKNNAKRDIFGVPDANEKAAEEVYVEKCLRFEMDFESMVNSITSEPKFTSAVWSHIPFKYHAGEEKLIGTSPLVNVSMTARGETNECSYKTTTGDGEFLIRNMIIKSDKNSSEDELGFTKDLILNLFPGQTRETVSVMCKDGTNMTIMAGNIWTGMYTMAHMKESTGFPDDDGIIGMYIKDWDIHYDEFFAEKKWTRYIKGDKVSNAPVKNPDMTELGSAKIYHKPAKE